MQMRDPEGVWMAAFTPEDPDDRNAFDAHMATVRRSPDITLNYGGGLMGHRARACRPGFLAPPR